MAEKEMLTDTQASLKLPGSYNYRLGPHILSYFPRFKCTGGELATIYRKHNRLHYSSWYPAPSQASAGSGYNHSRELGHFSRLGDAHQKAATWGRLQSRVSIPASTQGSEATWRSRGALLQKELSHPSPVNLNTLTMDR